MEMKVANSEAVLTIKKSDVTKAAKTLGYTLTSKEQTSVLETFCRSLKDNVDQMLTAVIKVVKGNTESAGVENTTTTTTTVDTKSFKWYYHSSSKNETKDAIAAALAANRPILIMACKPACDVCSLVWKNIKATGSLATYLKDRKLVGLKIEDTSAHFTTLAKNKNSFTGLDGVSGKKINSTAPFFALVRLKSSMKGKTKINLATSEVELYISGYGAAKTTNKTYNDIVVWLNDALNIDAYEASV